MGMVPRPTMKPERLREAGSRGSVGRDTPLKQPFRSCNASNEKPPASATLCECVEVTPFHRTLHEEVCRECADMWFHCKSRPFLWW